MSQNISHYSHTDHVNMLKCGGAETALTDMKLNDLYPNINGLYLHLMLGKTKLLFF